MTLIFSGLISARVNNTTLFGSSVKWPLTKDSRENHKTFILFSGYIINKATCLYKSILSFFLFRSRRAL